MDGSDDAGRVPSPERGPRSTEQRARALARLLRLEPRALEPLGGATGEVFGAGDVVLRLGPPARLDLEVTAAGAAATAVPVAEVLDRVDADMGSALLLRRVPGRVALDLAADPTRAWRRGAACGAAQRALATVPAPAGFPPGPSAPAAGTPALLHLDLHPLNVLLDDQDQVTAVLDWADARSGPADLDRARTWAMLHLDPAADPIRTHPAWRALVEGWTAGAALDALATGSRAWGCRYLLANLAGRCTARQLAPARRALARLTAEPGATRVG
jgi:hypothetical protein